MGFAGDQDPHNTVIQNGTFPTAIDYRFNGSTGLEIMNNLTDGEIDRNNGAQGTTAGNYRRPLPDCSPMPPRPIFTCLKRPLWRLTAAWS